MTSVQVPPVDLAPGMPSRVVTISATDITEGGQSMAGQKVHFALSDSLDVTSGGDVIAKTNATVVLDSNGDGRIRLPVYDENVRTWCGKDWAVLVSSSWGSQKAIRVPAGTSTIALSALPNIRPLRGRELQWALTGAGITIVEGSQWDASVSLDSGVLKFVLTVPPGGTAWWKGMLGSGTDLDTLADGAYGVLSGAAAEGMGLPEFLVGVIESYQTAGIQIYHVRNSGPMRMWKRAKFSDGWTAWERVDADSWYRGNLDEQTGTLTTLRPGLYLVRYVATAEAWGLPQRLIGQLEIIDAGDQRQVFYRPNDAGSGFGTKSSWELATDSSGVLRDRWQRSDKAIMRTAPVVLTAPAGEYGPVAVSREAVRLPFTVPTNVSRVRVHMRPWNYRTEVEWGPARLEGVMIAQAESEGSGTITGSRWYSSDAPGATVPGTGWTSDWFHVGLTPNSTFLLSYGAEWLDASRDLVMGTCWTHSDRAEYDSTADAIYQNGWGGFFLQPMDVWIECEAPSNVPIWGYFGASNTMGMDSGNPVQGAYPTLHARKHKAFCALTAAGGWSLMDDSAHRTATMRRFGFPARIMDRVYLDWGSNIAIRDASAEDAIAEMERWMNQQLPGLGSPPVHLLTQIAGPSADDTTDTVGTLSDWNEWIRYVAPQRPEVKGLHDVAAIFADPERPWTARPEFRASPGNVHFNAMGQKLRAAALDGEVQLPMLTAKNPSEVGGVTYLGDGVYEIS